MKWIFFWIYVIIIFTSNISYANGLNALGKLVDFIWWWIIVFPAVILLESLLIYLTGRYGFKKLGGYWWTVLGSFLGAIISIVIMYNLLQNINNYIIHLVVSIPVGIYFYFLSHKRNLKKQSS